MEKLIQIVQHIMITAIICYLVLCVFLFFMQDRMIFYPPSIDQNTYNRFQSNEIVLINSGEKIHGWQIPVDNNASKTVLYFGGNAEDAVWMNYEAKEYEVKQVFAFNYPGYGYSEGTYGELELYEHAERTYQHIKKNLGIEDDEIIVIGRSLGSAMACYLASKNKVAGMIMITPFDSLKRVAKKHYFFMPVDYLLKYNFPTIEYMKKTDVPSLMLAAENDEIISVKMNHLNSIKKDNLNTVILDNVGHNTIQSHHKYYLYINNFIKSLE